MMVANQTAGRECEQGQEEYLQLRKMDQLSTSESWFRDGGGTTSRTGNVVGPVASWGVSGAWGRVGPRVSSGGVSQHESRR